MNNIFLLKSKSLSLIHGCFSSSYRFVIIFPLQMSCVFNNLQEHVILSAGSAIENRSRQSPFIACKKKSIHYFNGHLNSFGLLIFDMPFKRWLKHIPNS